MPLLPIKRKSGELELGFLTSSYRASCISSIIYLLEM